MINLRWMMVALLVAWFGSLACAADPVINLRVRDSHTRLAITAFIHLEGPVNLNLRTDETGRVSPSAAPGDYRIEVTADGYKSMRSHFAVSQVGTLPVTHMTYMLEPDKPTSPEEDRAFKARLREGYTLVTGSAIDDETGKPLRGVRIRLERAAKETVTEASGDYFISIPTPPIINDRPTGIDTISAELPGYKTIIYRNILIAGDVSGEEFDMVKGSGVSDEDHRHKLLPAPNQAYFRGQATEAEGPGNFARFSGLVERKDNEPFSQTCERNCPA